MDPLPPDPYHALGLARDVDNAVIKSTYRKLVLKCHPDKVTDESLKKQKQEEFHKIQQAYELIGEEDARRDYDARYKLDSLRKEKAAREASAGPDVRTARYDVRTQAPAGATFRTTGPARYDDTYRPSRSSDDRYYEERARAKYDTYEAYPKTSSRSSREKMSPQKPSPQKTTTRESSDRTRSDYKKSRDKERDRERRYVASERDRDTASSGDERTRFEADFHRRNEEARREDARREAERRAYDDAKYKQKLNDQQTDAIHYIRSSKVTAERPSPERTASSRDHRDYYDARDSRSRRDRPEVVRRSSARPKDRRKATEIVDWGEDDRSPPSFKHSSSSPADIQLPRGVPRRSYTESSRDRDRRSPPPPLFRAETMPSVSSAASASRRKEPTAPRPSGLRESVPLEASSTAATTSPGIKKHYYTYATPAGGINVTPEDYLTAANGNYVIHEPNTQRHRSPSPLKTPLKPPPMGANRHVDPSPSKYATSSSIPPPPLGRSATTLDMGSSERGRSGKLYGEIDRDRLGREKVRLSSAQVPSSSSAAYPLENVSFSRRPRPEDVVSWGAYGGRSGASNAPKPGLSRAFTAAC